jgi:hypothetical protein
MMSTLPAQISHVDVKDPICKIDRRHPVSKDSMSCRGQRDFFPVRRRSSNGEAVGMAVRQQTVGTVIDTFFRITVGHCQPGQLFAFREAGQARW